MKIKNKAMIIEFCCGEMRDFYLGRQVVIKLRNAAASVEAQRYTLYCNGTDSTVHYCSFCGTKIEVGD